MCYFAHKWQMAELLKMQLILVFFFNVFRNGGVVLEPNAEPSVTKATLATRMSVEPLLLLTTDLRKKKSQLSAR